jgi:AAA family ATP:ADP antiporter
LATPGQATGLDRFLRLFSDVRAGEGFSALLLSINCGLILAAYYIIKPLRDGLVLAEYSAEIKSYLQVANVLALAVIVPLYGRLTDRFPRRRLINVVTWIFIGALGLFTVMGLAGLPLGILFFIYGSIFAVMIVAQFWSFANDIYRREEGERLFPIIAFGASLGGALGATFAGQIIEPLGLYIPMALAAGVLLLQLQITNFVDARERGIREAHLPDIKTTATIAASGLMPAPKSLEELEEMAAIEKAIYEAKAKGEPVDEPEAASGLSAFGLVWNTRYLLLICLLVMFLNWVNTNGEYILGKVISTAATEAVANGTTTLSAGAFIGSFYANFYAVVNIVGLLVQLFLTSRIVKFAGVNRAVMVLPIISMGVYSLIAFVPVLAAVRWAKTAENATDYSLNNTVRNMLFLPTTREQKYKGKQVSDSFFHRAGDVLSSATVFVGASVLALSTTAFALINLGLVAIWLVVAIAIGRAYTELVASGKAPPTRSKTVQHPFATGAQG